MNSTPKRKVLGRLAVLAPLALILVFGGALVQGGVAYVTTTGTSMEPGYVAGDLVVVRGAPSYQVGDVVAYRSSVLDTVVLHRIAERDGDRVVLKGDNNTWLDSERPLVEELIGRVWFRPPAWARLPAWMPARWPASFAAAAAAAVVVLGTTRSRKRRRTGQPMKQGQRGRSEHRSRRARAMNAVAGTAAVSFVAAVAITAVAFTRQPVAAASEPVTVTHRGTFTYSAAAPSGGAYADGRITTGEPVFLRLVSGIDVAFRYRAEPDAPSDISAEATIQAEIADTNGWRHRVELGPPAHLDSTSGVVRATLDLHRLQAIIDDVAATTGVRAGAHTVGLVVEVRVRGHVAGQPIDATFDPRLDFQLDSLQLRPAWDTGDETGNALTPESSTVVDITRSRDQQLGGFGINISVAAARRIGALVGAASALFAALSVIALRRRSGDEATAILSRYGERIIPVATAAKDGPNAVIDVTSMTHLVRLAEQYDCLILHEREILRERDDAADHFLFQLDRTVYRYTTRPTGRRAEQPHAPETKAG